MILVEVIVKLCVETLLEKKMQSSLIYCYIFALLTLKNSIKTIKVEQKQYVTKLVITIHCLITFSNISLRFNLAKWKTKLKLKAGKVLTKLNSKKF